MKRTDLIDRPTGRPPHFTLLLIAFIGVSGCFPPKPRTDGSSDPACGILYTCDHDQGRRENDETNTASTGGDSTDTSTATGTGPIQGD